MRPRIRLQNLVALQQIQFQGTLAPTNKKVAY